MSAAATPAPAPSAGALAGASSSPASSLSASAPPYTIILFYLYTRVADPAATLEWQQALCERLELKGRIRVAREGINGTLAGSARAIQLYIDDMNDLSQPHGGLFSGIEYKYSTSDIQPFPALGMFNVPELCATGAMAKSVELLLDQGQARLKKVQAPAAPAEGAGAGEEAKEQAPAADAPAAVPEDTHLTPAEFHQALLNFNPATDLLLDVRNSYETAIGTFEGAVDPKLRSFAQLPEYVTQNLDAIRSKKNILMFCTGGIRCEKACLYMQHRSGAKVQQLKGGIHKYMDEFPDGGLFRGKNFVFDGRLAMASEDKTVVGKCVHCATACDDLSESVICRVCKMFVILCPACKQTYAEKGWQIYCHEHILLAAGKDYHPIEAAPSAAAASPATAAPSAASSSVAAASEAKSSGAADSAVAAAADASGEDSPARPEDAWSPPADDPGCPEQLESFLARFTSAQLESAIGEIERILQFYKEKMKRTGSRSRNRKHNLHLQLRRLEEYLEKRRKEEAEERGLVWQPRPKETIAEKERRFREAKAKAKTDAEAGAKQELISFVPLLNV